MERTNVVMRGFVGLLAGPTGVVMSFDERLVIWLRLLGLLAGALVSLAMFWSIIQTRRERRQWAAAGLERERLKTHRERLRLCIECRAGTVRVQPCPIPERERGPECQFQVKSDEKT